MSIQIYQTILPQKKKKTAFKSNNKSDNKSNNIFHILAVALR